MNILPYIPAHKQACLALFGSNQGKYFDASELADFERFLERDTAQCPYYVVVDAGELLACGGFARFGDQATLCWGMVKRSKHKTGIGTLLLIHRLQAIESSYGKLPVNMETSQHTQGFYQRFGFCVQSVKPDGFGPGIDQVKMEYQPA